MKKEEFDRAFDFAFEDAVKKHLPSPDPDPSWARVEMILKKRRNIRKYRFIPYAVAAMVIIGAFLFATPSVSKAFTPFSQAIKSIQSGVSSIIFGNDSEYQGKAKTAPPPDNGNSSEGQVLDNGLLGEKHYSTWEEASQNIAFSNPKIGFVPQKYKLEDVVLFFRNGQAEATRAVLIYTNTKEKKNFLLTFRMLEHNETVTSGTDNIAGEYTEVQVNGQKAYLLITKDTRSSLDYMIGNIVVSITGSLTKDEIIQIAEKIK
ncbi:protein of unknown function [Paenibacillus sp. UNC496MF]|uniref:DUF4367 domain-containing protein n=1 Tax=Paenibacillus sp. UNC496MF TaxID=1502753 RepID=UPI0008EB1ECE|nr:DUF4367 domain-containing protein [Paenibacillus sp. UNC496MF]SFJ55923.1 protein of unknown function [Paenibacillus sp. UNC496MF]